MTLGRLVSQHCKFVEKVFVEDCDPRLKKTASSAYCFVVVGQGLVRGVFGGVGGSYFVRWYWHSRRRLPMWKVGGDRG